MPQDRPPLFLSGPSVTCHIELEDVCPTCRGTLLVDDVDINGDKIKRFCTNCNQHGTVLNDNGRAVIQLMKDYRNT